MPATKNDALAFLETQWSSVNENKIKGILSEIRLKQFLIQNKVHFVPGGWILVPGNPKNTKIPTLEKICLLPRRLNFSWQQELSNQNNLRPAEISAYDYFRHVGVRALLVDAPNFDETSFLIPTASHTGKRAVYPKPYSLRLCEVSPNGDLEEVSQEDVFSLFPRRNGNVGMRCYKANRLSRNEKPWDSPSVVSDLFWFEYCKYYFQIDFLLSNNDLDMFVVGPSGSPYPVELKSKSAAKDSALGEWFGIDMGPFAKLSFFIQNAVNNDALYIVEEVDTNRGHLEWHGIRFSQLVKSCSWVGQAGGTGMMGGASTTYKVPKAAFTPLDQLLPVL